MKENTLAKSRMMILKDFNSLNKIGMHDSRKKREGKGKERKTWRKGKALPYRRKLTNNVE